MFRAYISVVSEVLSYDELVRTLGPASGNRERSHGQVASWRRDLFRDAPSWPEALDIFLGHDSDVLADRIRHLVAAGTTDAWLVVVQEVDDPDDDNQKGIWLDRGVIDWMARAMMGLDIDQYIY